MRTASCNFIQIALQKTTYYIDIRFFSFHIHNSSLEKKKSELLHIWQFVIGDSKKKKKLHHELAYIVKNNILKYKTIGITSP